MLLWSEGNKAWTVLSAVLIYGLLIFVECIIGCFMNHFLCELCACEHSFLLFTDMYKATS